MYTFPWPWQDRVPTNCRTCSRDNPRRCNWDHRSRPHRRCRCPWPWQGTRLHRPLCRRCRGSRHSGRCRRTGSCRRRCLWNTCFDARNNSRPMRTRPEQKARATSAWHLSRADHLHLPPAEHLPPEAPPLPHGPAAKPHASMAAATAS
jgi:hypothetical protein